METKPHKCRQTERYFVYFLHSFGIFRCRLHTDWSLRGTLPQVLSHWLRCYLLRWKVSGYPIQNSPSSQALIYISLPRLLFSAHSSLSGVLYTFLFLYLFVCLLDFSHWNIPAMEEENLSVLSIIIPQCQGQCFPQSRHSINFCWMNQWKNGY